MARAIKLKSDGRTITVRVPISIRKRGGRKVVLAPDGFEQDSSTLRCQHVVNAMVKALARAFRWREMLEVGRYATVAEIAEGEQINESYVCRLLRLTLLAPEIVEAIIEGKQSSAMTLATVMRGMPIVWNEQHARIAA